MLYDEGKGVFRRGANCGVHTDLLEYISSAFWHLPDGLDGFVQALYAIGGEAPQFLHPNSPYFAQDPKYWGTCLLMAIEAKSKNHSAGNCAPPNRAQMTIWVVNKNFQKVFAAAVVGKFLLHKHFNENA